MNIKIKIVDSNPKDFITGDWFTILEASKILNIKKEALFKRINTTNKFIVVNYKSTIYIKFIPNKKELDKRKGIRFSDKRRRDNIVFGKEVKLIEESKNNYGLEILTHELTIKYIGMFILRFLKKNNLDKKFIVVWEGLDKRANRLHKEFCIKFTRAGKYKGKRIMPDFIVREKETQKTLYGEVGGLDIKKICTGYNEEYLVWIPIDFDFLNKAYFIYNSYIDGPQSLNKNLWKFIKTIEKN